MALRNPLWIDHPFFPMQTAGRCYFFNSLKNTRAGGIPFPCQTFPHLFLRPILSAKINAQQTSALSQVQEKPGVVSNTIVFPGTQYMFHAEGGGQVRVFLENKASKYAIKVDVMIPGIEPPLQLHWGLFRSDSTDWVLLEPESAPPQTTFVTGRDEAMRTPFQRCDSSSHILEFEISCDMTPFYISFVLHKPAVENQEELWIRSSYGSNFSVPVGVLAGYPQPLGFTLFPDGSANFALFSKNATNVILCLYKPGDVEPAIEIDMQSSFHKSGDVWHLQLPSIGSYDRYGYRGKGEESWENGNRFHKRRILLDPYAKFIAPHVPGQEELPSPATALGWLTRESGYDWEDETSPCIPPERLVVYRLDVAGFTRSCNDLSDELRGTFMGVAEKIPHLKFLGVNAIILQPLFSFDKTQGQYYPISFFSLTDVYERRCPSSSLSASTSLKNMVKSLHQNGIEVILDVVYTHTAENGDDAPETVSFRGIDNETYYVLDHRKRVLLSEPGKTNMFNCNHPAVHSVILESLRYWVEEFHVDGFSFVNAGGLLKGPHGEELSRPLLIEAISFDPVLSKSKLICDDCWPSTAAVSPRVKFPHWKRWCEWNKYFHEDVTAFFNGEQGKLSDLATRICGSADMFANGRGPSFSFNFVSSSYGVTLADTVASTQTPGQPSPGVDDVEKTRAVRSRQMRNLFVTLFLSQGVPVLNMGDEYGISSSKEPGKPRVFDWTKLETESALCQLISSLSSLRNRRQDLFQKRSYIDAKNLSWHGPELLNGPLWTDPNRSFLAVTLKSSDDGAGTLFIVYNAQDEVVEVKLPELPEETYWYKIVDTVSPQLDTMKESKTRSKTAQEVEPFSVLVFEQLFV